ALVPILPTYATKVVGVSTVEYTIAIIIGGIGCAISMLFLSKIIDKNGDRKSTRLNSSHVSISYAVFCLKKKKTIILYYILYSIHVRCVLTFVFLLLTHTSPTEIYTLSLHDALPISALVPILPTYATKVVGVSTVEYTIAIIIGGIGCAISMLFLSKIIDKNGTLFMYSIIFGGFVLYTIMIFALSIITDIKLVWGLALFIGLMYGILLPAWNTFMASHIHMDEQEETWGVFNSVQGFGSMIGPLVGG